MVVTAQPWYTTVLLERLEEARELAARTKKALVLVLQQFPVPEDGEPLVPPVRESIANVLAFVELGTPEHVSHVLELAAGTFDAIALDCDHKLPESRAIIDGVAARAPAERLLRYSDNQAWFDSALDMVQRLQQGVTGRTGVICGQGVLADQFASVLPRLGATLAESRDVERLRSVDFVLGAAQKQPCIFTPVVEAVGEQASIYDLGIGSISREAADLARARSLPLFRLDNRAGISSAIVRLLETDHMVRRLMGHVHVRGVDIVAGGLLAPPGAVVVDDIREPTVIFGISDGAGRFRRSVLSEEDRARIEFVQSLMVKVR